MISITNKLKKSSKKNKYSFIKNLTTILKKKNGRNNKGKIVLRRCGGGHLKRYRFIDFKFKELKGLILNIEYDPNRSAFIAACINPVTKKRFYQILTEGQKVGDFIGIKQENMMFSLPGNISYLYDVPIGSLIHSLELKPGKGSQFSRAAGTYVKLLNKEPKLNLAKVRLPSKKDYIISLDTKCILGSVSNTFHNQKNLEKAGRSRWLGNRPKVRGVAMNPVDHPHGGGEGKTSGGRCSVTPWGKITKGQPTAKKRKNTLYQF